MIVYRCQDSIESIFTAIYLAYEEKRNHGDTLLSLNDDPILFAENIPVTADEYRAKKVMTTLVNRFGDADYLRLCQVLASEDEDKAQNVYQTIVNGFRNRLQPNHLFDQLANDSVLYTYKTSVTVWREVHHLMGFTRFQELENGILYAKIGPKNNILTFLMPHFADRFPNENFALYDEKRMIFGIHPAGQQWFLRLGEQVGNLNYSEEEFIYSSLFREFCKAIAIKERTNLKLQRQLLPLRFREYMMEFQ